MSSSFLYLGIVVVWAFVLVPRWIRRQHAHSRASVEVDVEVDVEYAAEYDAEPQYHYYDDADDAEPDGYSPGVPEVDCAVEADARVSKPVPSNGSGQVRAHTSRSRMLRARRRLLSMHLLLTAVAAACAAMKITSWWVIATPAAMLFVYLLLLRAAAVADAEQARRRAAVEARARAVRQRAYAAAMEREPEPSAEIIDISARVGDQLYDQYADATVRAVGD